MNRFIFSASSRALLPLGALLVFCASWWLGQLVSLNAPLTTDENAYVFQAYCFADGILARPAPEPKRMFPHEMLIMDDQAGWLSRYPPGHAAWLTPGVLAGQPRLMVALAAALSFLVMGRLGMLLGFSRFLMPALLLVSPYFLFMHGTLLSHSSGLLAASLMLLAYIRLKQGGSLLFGVLAGLAWATLFLNRTYTAALIAVPFGVDAVVDLVRQRTARNLAGTLLFVMASGLGLALFLFYNQLTVGDPWTPTYLYYQASDALGFGPRPPGQIPSVHTPGSGLRAMGENLLLLDRWLFGFPGSLVLVLGLGLFGWNRRWSPLCLAAPFCVWLGYVLFWFDGIRLVGPVYYFETLVFLLVLACFGLQRLHRSAALLPVRLRPVLAALSWLVVACCALLFSRQQSGLLRAWQDLGGQYRALLQKAPPGSLILAPRIEGMRYVSRGMAFNPRGLASDPLVASTDKLDRRVLAGAFPGRTPYSLVLDNGRLRLEPFVDQSPIRIHMSVADTLCRTGENHDSGAGERQRIARSGIHPPDWLAYGVSLWIGPGSYHLQVSLQVEGIRADAPLVVDVATGGGSRILARRTVSASGTDMVEVAFHVTRSTRIEPRIYYNGTGTVAAGIMKIVQVNDAGAGKAAGS